MGLDRGIDRILTKVIKAEPGIKKVILCDRGGAVLAHVSKHSYLPVEVEGVGAIASAVFCANEAQGDNLDIGKLNIVLSEYDEGKIFVAYCGTSWVLCVITDINVIIGMIRIVIKSAGHEIEKYFWETSDPPPPPPFVPPSPSGGYFTP